MREQIQNNWMIELGFIKVNSERIRGKIVRLSYFVSIKLHFFVLHFKVNRSICYGFNKRKMLC